MTKLIVAKDGSGDFTTIQAAVDAVPVHPLEAVTIFIKNGVYEETVTLPDNKPDLYLIGEDKENTILTRSTYARMQDSKGKELGTFQTATIYLFADRIFIENLTIENKAGWGEEIGQALALYAAGDKCTFSNVRLLGNQDTFYSARGRQYFLNSYIEGHVDFIFGSGTVFFSECEIHSLRKGYITAASTPAGQKYGFIFLNCRLTGSAPDSSVFLGRPWRPHAHTVFINTWMGPHIRPEGWDNWRNAENEQTARFGEADSSGPGAHEGRRVRWSRKLSPDEIKRHTIDNIFKADDDWLPFGEEK